MDLAALRFDELVDLAGRALVEANGRDLTELTDGEVTDAAIATTRVARLADAAQVAVVGRVDVMGSWQPAGAKSATAWVAWKCRLPRGRAGAALKCARRLRSMPTAEAAFLAGEITADHVRLLASCQTTSPDAFARDEADLIETARTMLFQHFERICRRWVIFHEPDRAEADAETLNQQRRLDCSRTYEDMWALDALLDPVSGAVFHRELTRLEQDLFEADWAEARSRLGEAATTVDLARTPKQRRADALRIMAERSAAKPDDAKEARVLLHVLAGTKSLERMCELSDGTQLTPGQLLPLLRWTDFARVVFDGPSRVIDVGVRQRLFTGAIRLAVEMRDLECAHPSCTTRFERCEVDHVEPYEDGGLTVQTNGQLLCPFHHRRKERRTPPAA